MRTVQRPLKEFGPFGTAARKKSLLTHEGRKERIQLVKGHVEWEPEDWNKVFFADGLNCTISTVHAANSMFDGVQANS